MATTEAPARPITTAGATTMRAAVVEGFTKVFYPEASNTVIFVIMAVVLLVRPSGLFGRSS